jgi:hypothetical protein
MPTIAMALLSAACMVAGGLAVLLWATEESEYAILFFIFSVILLAGGSVFLALTLGVFLKPGGFRYAVLCIGLAGVVGGAFTPGGAGAKATYIGINLAFALLSVPLFSRRSQQWIVSRRSPYRPALRAPLAGFPVFAVTFGLLALGATAMTGALEQIFTEERATYKPVEAEVIGAEYCYRFTYTSPGDTMQWKATSCEVTESMGWQVGDVVTIYVDPTRPTSCIPQYRVSWWFMGMVGTGAIVLWGCAVLLARKRRTG